MLLVGDYWLGMKDRALWFRVQGLGFRSWGLGLWVQGSNGFFRIQVSGFKILG